MKNIFTNTVAKLNDRMQLNHIISSTKRFKATEVQKNWLKELHKEFPLTVDNFLVAKETGYTDLGCGYIEFNFNVLGVDSGLNRIVINDALLELPDALMSAVIAHEAGHLMCQHFGRPTRTPAEELEQEFEADEFSHNLGFPITEYLQYIYIKTGKTNKELKIRIARLMKLSKSK